MWKSTVPFVFTANQGNRIRANDPVTTLSVFSILHVCDTFPTPAGYRVVQPLQPWNTCVHSKQWPGAHRGEGPWLLSQQCVCVCVCACMNDSGVLGHLDCPCPALLSVHFSPPLTLPYSFPVSPPPPPSVASLPLSTSISGSIMVQSLLVGLPARFPSRHSINSLLLTLSPI